MQRDPMTRTPFSFYFIQMDAIWIYCISFFIAHCLLALAFVTRIWRYAGMETVAERQRIIMIIRRRRRRRIWPMRSAENEKRSGSLVVVVVVVIVVGPLQPSAIYLSLKKIKEQKNGKNERIKRRHTKNSNTHRFLLTNPFTFIKIHKFGQRITFRISFSFTKINSCTFSHAISFH